MKDRLRVLIVDDETLARSRLRRLLDGEEGVEIAGEAASAEEARRLVASERPDLLFLDVQMPGEDGFELLESLPAESAPAVIFVTAFDQHALRAFEVHALDYLLKPFDRERLRLSLERAREALARRAPGELGEQLRMMLQELRGEQQHLNRLVIRSVGRIVFVAASEVDWIEAAGNYVRLHIGKDSHLLRETMSSLETRLDPRVFARIHRSTIVNIERIRELQHIFHGDYAVLLRDGTKLTLSRGYREQFERLVGGTAELQIPG
ncbi:MAG: response regulator transcription factor [Thermoanaerobaculia bacterium]|nr:MAG: response regulator transcription factor [Thermoanaerobaculia bacterium]